MEISDNTATGLQDDIICPIIIEEFREQVSKRMKNDNYLDLLAVYVISIFQVSESSLGTEVDLVEDDFRLDLDDYNSNFITYELEPGICNFKENSEALLEILQPEYELFNNSVDIQFDDFTRKTKLVVRPSIKAIKFDEKSFFFCNVLRLNPYWGYKHYIEYISQEFVNLSTTNKLHLK